MEKIDPTLSGPAIGDRRNRGLESCLAYEKRKVP